MPRKTNNNAQCVVSTGGMSLAPLAVIIINFIVAFLKYNNTDASQLNVCSFDFLILIILLFLNSVDILSAHKGFKGGCVLIENVTSIISGALSFIIIMIAAGAWMTLWNIDSTNNLIFNGKLSYIHTFTGNQSFSLSFVAEMYLASSAMQLLARVFKFIIDRSIKRELSE